MRTFALNKKLIEPSAIGAAFKPYYAVNCDKKKEGENEENKQLQLQLAIKLQTAAGSGVDRVRFKVHMAHE